MPFITVPKPKKEYQISFDDILNGVNESAFYPNEKDTHDTKTVWRSNTPQALLDKINTNEMIKALADFNNLNSYYINADKNTLYETFLLGKKGKGLWFLLRSIIKTYDNNSGVHYNYNDVINQTTKEFNRIHHNHPTAEHECLKKEVFERITGYLTPLGFKITVEDLEDFTKEAFRRIDAPKDDFKKTLDSLRYIFEKKLFSNYHTTAFAYIKGRSFIDALKRHQKNNSRWFLKIDFKNFFGNTTINFVINQLKLIYPFNEILLRPNGETELKKALSLCFLNGGLPQGTPISPTITNLMMIPVDHAISKAMRNRTPHICYTRYADDILLSSDISFKWTDVQREVIEILQKANAPFTLNVKKTRYGSRAGANWNFGVMLNKDNQITIGHEKKKKFKAKLFSLLNDYKNNNPWDVEDVQVLGGLISFYSMVEREAIEKIIDSYSKKFGVNVREVIKEILCKV